MYCPLGDTGYLTEYSLKKKKKKNTLAMPQRLNP